MDAETAEQYSAVIWHAAALSIALTLCFWGITIIAHPLISSSLLSLGTSYIIAFILWSAISLFSLRKQVGTREWHACEHKSLELLEQKIEPAITELKKAHKTYYRCGTGSIILALKVSILLWSLCASMFFDTAYIRFLRFLLPILWISLISLLILILLFSAGAYSWIKVVFVFILLPFAVPYLIFPFLAEYIFAVREPSEDKMRETVEDLQKFIAENNLYGNE